MWNWKLYTMAALGLLVVVIATRRSPGQAPIAGVRTATANGFPEPPQQRTPWTPPKTGLPADLIQATATLFTQGLADPRGCEYRVVELSTGDSTGGPLTHVSTHAWLFPGGPPRARLAVCWNGLVYPVLRIGPRADLRADVVAAVEPLERKHRAEPNTFEVRWSLREPGSVRAAEAAPLRACLLLRLGEEPLARRMWSICKDQLPGAEAGPYLGLAGEWLWYLFDRTVAAHVRGDDRRALADVQLLVTAHQAVEAEALRMGYPRPDPPAGRKAAATLPYVQFGTDPAELLADQEQRAQHTPPRVSHSNPEPHVATLIRELDKVSERQWSQPGGVDLAASPEVHALVREGSGAVGPLIDCMEHDTRLTRSVQYWRDYATYREVLPVRSAAYVALTQILWTDRFGDNPPTAPQDWPQPAQRVRAYWQRYHGLPREERWYRELQDDAGGPGQWLEAASNITFPACPDGQPTWKSSFMGISGGNRSPQSWQPGSRALSLRRKTAPSVTTLIARRVTQAEQAGKKGSRESRSLPVDLALCLSAWDPHGALPTLRRLFARNAALSRPKKKGGAPAGIDPDDNASQLAALTLARCRGNDPQALGDYTRWLLAASPTFRIATKELFEPLWRYPDAPSVMAAEKRIFAWPESPWRRAVEIEASTDFGGNDVVNTPLLGLESFRQLVYQWLADRTPSGTASLGRDGYLNVKSNGGSMSAEGGNPQDPRASKPGIEVPIRRCDLVAWQLSRIGGAPEFQLYWRASSRHAALREIVAFLRRYGPRLRHSPYHDRVAQSALDVSASMAFTPLSGPATPVDVREARAIFSVTGIGPSRVLHPARWPLPARWTTLRKHLRIQSVADAESGGIKSVSDFDQDGWVWQAEEVVIQGRPQRFYGFVGPHEIVRVPANEIEFLPDQETTSDWRRLTNGLSCRLGIEGNNSEREANPQDPPRLFAPPAVKVDLFNRSGMPTRVPSPCLRRQGKSLSIPDGIELRLQRAKQAPSPSRDTDSGAVGQGQWETVVPRSYTSFGARERRKLLRPAERVSVLSLKLDELYRPMEPGLYRLEVDWTGNLSGAPSGRSNEVRFILRD